MAATDRFIGRAATAVAMACGAADAAGCRGVFSSRFRSVNRYSSFFVVGMRWVASASRQLLWTAAKRGAAAAAFWVVDTASKVCAIHLSSAVAAGAAADATACLGGAGECRVRVGWPGLHKNAPPCDEANLRDGRKDPAPRICTLLV